jgi:peptidoglycan/LPS O-acetylase OafA/YrhL
MSKAKNLALESLRGYAALSVVIAHFIVIFLPAMHGGNVANQKYAFEHWFHQSPFVFLIDGNFSVCVFFVMSGYVLTKALFDTGSKALLVERITGRYLRLVIPALASVLLTLIIIRLGNLHLGELAKLTGAQLDLDYASFYPKKATLAAALSYGLGTVWWAPFDAKLTYNPVLWTMRLELWGSFMVFALAALFFVIKLTSFRLGILLLLALAFALKGGEYGIFYMPFLAGVWLAQRREVKTYPLAVYVLVLLVSCYLGGYTNSQVFQWLRSIGLAPWLSAQAVSPYALFHIIGSVGVVWVVLDSAAVARLMAHRFGVYLGKVSFSLYLIHMPVLHSVVAALALYLLKSGLRYSLIVLACFALYAVLCGLLAHVFERWVDRVAVSAAKGFASAVLKSNHARP